MPAWSLLVDVRVRPVGDESSSVPGWRDPGTSKKKPAAPVYYGAERGRGDAVPAVNGQPWHLSIHMFEGYAGTSDSGFRPKRKAGGADDPGRE